MEKLYKLLSDVQASLFLLFHKTWVFHWDVEGPDFHQLHTLFGEQYGTIYDEIDRISEHMRYLNAKPVSTLTRVVEVSHIKEASDTSNANYMLFELLEDNKKIIQILSEASQEADNQKQLATANLLQDLMETHGKFVWMLRSFKKG
jgi:starvation-inducible DNA-binding protein